MIRVLARKTARELTDNELKHIGGGVPSYATVVTGYQYDESSGTLLVQYEQKQVDDRTWV